MKRLRDQRGSSDPIVAAAARLVSVREPLADDTARRQRVRGKLRRRRKAPVGAAWVRAAAMLLLVCSVAAASAMIGRVAQTIRAKIAAARAERQSDAAGKSHRRHAAAATPAIAPTAPTAPTEATPPTAPTEVTPPTAPTEATPPTAPTKATPPTAPSVTAPAAPAAPTPPTAPTAPTPSTARMAPAPAVAAAAPRESDEQRLVVDAVRALRHEHAPDRAAQLLQRYLERYPNGVAAEDALALALEATIGRDPARAAAFARRYLARYPSGRWSQLARRALEP